MSDIRPTPDARRVIGAGCGICGRALLAAALLVRGGSALAADQAPPVAVAGTLAARSAPLESARFSEPFSASLFSAPLFSAPLSYPLPLVADPKSLSAKDFRPRGRSVLDRDFQVNVADGALIDDTTVWQRLAEYRTRDRVRVLTLWESGASTVSLQAGKRGDPSLQWTSRLMNRGGATRGLLDHFFPVIGTHESGGGRGFSHSTSPQPAAKPAALLAAPHLGSPVAPP
jgi:hypothetical protein